MESRKRFKADISNSYAQKLLNKKKSTTKSKQNNPNSLEDEPQVVEVLSIPSNLLPKPKKRDATEREYVKPDHWAQPKQEAKKSREEVFKTEKNNMSKLLPVQQGWRLSARIISTAINSKSETRCTYDPEEDIPSKDEFGRKNHAREYLKTFFDSANSIREGQRGGKRKTPSRPKRVLKKVGKLASGIEPEAVEIVL